MSEIIEIRERTSGSHFLVASVTQGGDLVRSALARLL